MEIEKIEIPFEEGMPMEEGDVVEEREPEYDKEMYAQLELAAPPKKKVVVRLKKQQTQPTPGKTEIVDDVDDVDDAVLLKSLNKKFKTNFATLDEFNKSQQQPPTPETDEARNKRLQKEKLQYALDNEVVTPDQLTAFNKDLGKSDRQLVWEAFLKKHENSGKSEDELLKKFQKLYAEETDQAGELLDAELNEERQADIKGEAERLRKKLHPEMYALDNKFTEHQKKIQEEKDNEQKVMDFVKDYTTDLNEVFSGINKDQFNIKSGDEGDDDEEEVDFEYPKDAIEAVKKEFLTTGKIAGFIANYSKEGLKKAVIIALKEATDDKRIVHVARSYAKKRLEKKKMGRKHLDGSGAGGDETVIERDEEMYALLKDHIPQAGGS